MVECGSVDVFGRSLVCVCVYRIGKESVESGMGGGVGGTCPSMVNELGKKGKSLAAANVGVRCRGDGVDSCVQVGVKPPGGLGFV